MMQPLAKPIKRLFLDDSSDYPLCIVCMWAIQQDIDWEKYEANDASRRVIIAVTPPSYYVKKKQW